MPSECLKSINWGNNMSLYYLQGSPGLTLQRVCLAVPLRARRVRVVISVGERPASVQALTGTFMPEHFLLKAKYVSCSAPATIT